MINTFITLAMVNDLFYLNIFLMDVSTERERERRKVERGIESRSVRVYSAHTHLFLLLIVRWHEFGFLVETFVF